MTLSLFTVARLRLVALAILAFAHFAHAREESLCKSTVTISVPTDLPSPLSQLRPLYHIANLQKLS